MCKFLSTFVDFQLNHTFRVASKAVDNIPKYADNTAKSF